MGTTLKLETLPKGFRFRPTDEELVSHYLRLKINGRHSAVKVIPEVDVCRWEPWDLPALSVIKSDDPEWFFFCPRDRKYPNGHRSNRATEAGYWKATGKDRTIKSRKSSPSNQANAQLIGMKKTLVFYKGRAPKGARTNWIMHEYRATEPDLDGTGPGQGDYVLCRLFHKADERLDTSKYDEVENTGSSPLSDKSSPDDVSSDPSQEPASLDIRMNNDPEVEDIKINLVDESDHVAGAVIIPGENCASDQVYYPEMKVQEPSAVASLGAYNPFDGNMLETLASHNNCPISGSCIGSPFANDFGNEQSEMHFQDGSSEQDVSLSQLLEDLQNQGIYLFEDTVRQKNPNVMNDNLVFGQFDGLNKHQTPPTILGIPNHGEMSQVQEQAFPGFFQPSPSIDTFHGLFYTPKNDLTYPNTDGTSSINATGIKIRPRQTRNQQVSTSSTSQGTAPRRIRLSSPEKPVRCGNPNSIMKPESESVITGGTEEFDETSYKSQESKTCQMSKNADEKESTELKPSALSTTLTPRGRKSLKIYVVGIYLVAVLSVVFLGILRYPISAQVSKGF